MRREKIFTLSGMYAERERLRAEGQELVFTNGCFDLLHPGHLRYLRKARQLGDWLVVAVNTDDSVSRLKGERRPLMPLAERLEILAALEVVDYVIAFDEDTPGELIKKLFPDVLVKGGDWKPELIVGKDTVESVDGRVYSLPFVEGYSTSSLIARIAARSSRV